MNSRISIRRTRMNLIELEYIYFYVYWQCASQIYSGNMNNFYIYIINMPIYTFYFYETDSAI